MPPEEFKRMTREELQEMIQRLFVPPQERESAAAQKVADWYAEMLSQVHGGEWSAQAVPLKGGGWIMYGRQEKMYEEVIHCTLNFDPELLHKALKQEE